MRAGVVVFPGSNCDRDVAVALRNVTGRSVTMLWHRDAELPPLDLIVLPGGFSYGDYLRCGAMAAHSPVLREVRDRARAGVHVLGICNGFQVLCETGLLPGVLMRNASLHFICRDVTLRVDRNDTAFTGGYGAGQVVRIPVAHNEGNYFADADTLDRLEGEGRVVFRYCADDGTVGDDDNPNGSQRSIAGIVNGAGTVLGLMPHPERCADPALEGVDGLPLFESLVAALS